MALNTQYIYQHAIPNVHHNKTEEQNGQSSTTIKPAIFKPKRPFHLLNLKFLIIRLLSNNEASTLDVTHSITFLEIRVSSMASHQLLQRLFKGNTFHPALI